MDEAQTDQAPAAAGTVASRSGDATVIAKDVTMTYRVYRDRHPSVQELVLHAFRSREYREIHAVRDVTFTAHSGEVIGVVGRNGSGKSTLLRGLAGLQPVTAGEVYARNQPVLLGVGAALQPELSGRRNIELGALALRMDAREVKHRIEAIADFADVGEFIDMPLKTYSSGMRARLHFAIASAVEPDILLIDEALAFGDEDFKKRSDQRIQELKAQAGTVCIVSHNLASLQDQCKRMLWIESGRLVGDGKPQEVAESYKAFVQRRTDGHR